MYVQRYTLEEVAKHADWLLVNGKVVDFAAFRHKHPGGQAILTQYAGL